MRFECNAMAVRGHLVFQEGLREELLLPPVLGL
jgi:hypothetical protein